MQSGPIFCLEPLEYRRNKALELGADLASDPLVCDTFSLIGEAEPLLLDVVFECSGSQKAVDDAIRILKPGGKLVLIGIPADARYVFDMDLLRRKELSIQNTRRQNHCVNKSISLINNGLPVNKMITHRFTPEKTQAAFDMVSGYNDGVIKAIIDFA